MSELKQTFIDAAAKLEEGISHSGNGQLSFSADAVEQFFKDRDVEMSQVLSVQKVQKEFVQCGLLAASNAGHKVMEQDASIQRTVLVHKLGGDKAEFSLDREKTITVRNPAKPDEPARQETRPFFQTARYGSGAGKSNAGLNNVKAHFKASLAK